MLVADAPAGGLRLWGEGNGFGNGERTGELEPVERGEDGAVSVRKGAEGPENDAGKGKQAG